MTLLASTIHGVTAHRRAAAQQDANGPPGIPDGPFAFSRSAHSSPAPAMSTGGASGTDGSASAHRGR